MTQFWGVDECTATLERDLGDGDYQLYASYEGEISDRDNQFVFKEDESNFQAVKIADDKGDYRVEVLYIFVSPTNASEDLLNELNDAIAAQ